MVVALYIIFITWFASDIVLLISTTPQLRKNWFAVTQRHLRLNALHTINPQSLYSNLETQKNRSARKAAQERMAVMAKETWGVKRQKQVFYNFFLIRRI